MLKIRSRVVLGALLVFGVLSNNIYASGRSDSMEDRDDEKANFSPDDSDTKAKPDAAAAKARNLRLWRTMVKATGKSGIRAVAALIDERPEIIELLRGPDLFQMIACPEVLNWFLDREQVVDIDQQNDHGEAPLNIIGMRIRWGMDFINGGTPDLRNMLRALIGRRANPLALDDRGRTARRWLELFLAEQENQGSLSPEMRAYIEEMIRVLREAEAQDLIANPNAKRDALAVFRARLAALRARLEAAESPEERKRIEARIERMEQTLTALEAAGSSDQDSEEDEEEEDYSEEDDRDSTYADVKPKRLAAAESSGEYSEEDEEEDSEEEEEEEYSEE
jgi:hypothetical protein